MVLIVCEPEPIATAFPVDGFSLSTVRPDGNITSSEFDPGEPQAWPGLSLSP
jgi:hypothetical protein